MRTQLFGSFVALAALVGCGGDDGKIKVPDAKKFMDAAVDAPHLCGIDPTIGNLTFGSMTTPIARNNFDRPDMGADAGRLEFFIAARLGMNTTPPIDALFIDVLQPGTAMAPTPFQTGVPYNFEPDATTQGSITADAYLLGDLDQTAMTVQNFEWAQSGSVTFSTFETPKANTAAAGMASNGSKHFGTVTMVPFKEIDQMTGELIDGGCMTTMGGLGFFVQQDTTALPAGIIAKQEEMDPALVAGIRIIQEFKAKRRAELLQQ
jgi:hypothetical protein